MKTFPKKAHLFLSYTLTPPLFSQPIRSALAVDFGLKFFKKDIDKIIGTGCKSQNDSNYFHKHYKECSTFLNHHVLQDWEIYTVLRAF